MIQENIFLSPRKVSAGESIPLDPSPLVILLLIPNLIEEKNLHVRTIGIIFLVWF